MTRHLTGRQQSLPCRRRQSHLEVLLAISSRGSGTRPPGAGTSPGSAPDGDWRVPGPTAPGWLKTVTTNLCLNHLSRYRARWQFFSELDRPEDDESYAARVPSRSAGAGQQLQEADRQARLERALRELPDHQRVPLVLFHFESMTYQEIASTLRVSLGKVKTDIHRGRESLKKELSSGDESD